MKSVFDLDAGATAFEFARRDGLDGHKEIMQAARTGQTAVQGRLQHRFGFGQLALGEFGRQKLQETFWADASPAREQSLEMVFAEVRGAGDRREVRLIQEVGPQVRDGLLDALVVQRSLGDRN